MAVSVSSLEKVLNGFNQRLSEEYKENGFVTLLSESKFSSYEEDDVSLYKIRIDHSLNSINIIGKVYNESKEEIFCSINPLTSNSVNVICDTPINGTLVLFKNPQ